MEALPKFEQKVSCFHLNIVIPLQIHWIEYCIIKIIDKIILNVEKYK